MSLESTTTGAVSACGRGEEDESMGEKEGDEGACVRLWPIWCPHALW